MGHTIISIKTVKLNGHQTDIDRACYTEFFGKLIHGCTDTPCSGSTGKQDQTDTTDNGSFFRVKNISMSYEFPTALVNKIKLQRLRVYGYMDNVWVFSKSKTYPDPENINTNGYANGSEYPLPHKFTLGAEITF